MAVKLQYFSIPLFLTHQEVSMSYHQANLLPIKTANCSLFFLFMFHYSSSSCHHAAEVLCSSRIRAISTHSTISSSLLSPCTCICCDSLLPSLSVLTISFIPFTITRFFHYLLSFSFPSFSSLCPAVLPVARTLYLQMTSGLRTPGCD